MEFELRIATPDDVDAIMALETATFETDAWSSDSMSSELGSEHTHYLFAFDPATPDVLAGYGGLLAPEDSVEADIQTLAVAPAARRNGLGRTLVTALLAEAAVRGAAEVFLEVRADNPNARALYDSLGFEQIAVRTKYYQPDGVDAQVMRVRL
jgi:ribosomal-protein-alanine N-acetyltransferase